MVQRRVLYVLWALQIPTRMHQLRALPVQQAPMLPRGQQRAQIVPVERLTWTPTLQPPALPAHQEASQAQPRHSVRTVLLERWIMILCLRRPALRVRRAIFQPPRLQQAARSVQLDNLHPMEAVPSARCAKQASIWTRLATMLRQTALAVREGDTSMVPAVLKAQTALLAMLVDMEQEGVLPVCVLVTAPLVGIPAQQALRDRRQPTVFYALQVDTAQEAALRVSALVIVPLVGTPQARLAQVQQRLTALHACLGHMVTRQEASAALPVLLVRTWNQ